MFLGINAGSCVHVLFDYLLNQSDGGRRYSKVQSRAF